MTADDIHEFRRRVLAIFEDGGSEAGNMAELKDITKLINAIPLGQS